MTIKLTGNHPTSTRAAFVLIAAALLATACESVVGTPPTSAKASVDKSFTRCPLTQPVAKGLLTLNSASDWAAQIQGPEAEVLGTAVSWSSSRVLVVRLGAVATGGHSVRLSGDEMAITNAANGGELQIQARHFPPPLDAMVAQTFTSPCVIAAVPRAGWRTAKLSWVE